MFCDLNMQALLQATTSSLPEYYFTIVRHKTVRFSMNAAATLRRNFLMFLSLVNLLEKVSLEADKGNGLL